jgi:hypothetical protein
MNAIILQKVKIQKAFHGSGFRFKIFGIGEKTVDAAESRCGIILKRGGKLEANNLQKASSSAFRRTA